MTPCTYRCIHFFEQKRSMHGVCFAFGSVWDRTTDHSINSRMLYQLSYRAIRHAMTCT